MMRLVDDHHANWTENDPVILNDWGSLLFF